MLFGLRHSYLAKLVDSLILPFFVFFFVVVHQIFDSDRLLPHGLYFNQVKDFSLQLFVFMTFILILTDGFDHLVS